LKRDVIRDNASRFSLVGSSSASPSVKFTRSVPMSSSTPPSSDRQSDPWSAVWISAYIRLELDAAIATSILPTGGFGMPAETSTFFHVAPPSCVMCTPLPGVPW
jgi:hypothetical protein